MLYIKDKVIVSDYKLVKSDGTIVLNAPKEEWLAEGWLEYEVPVEDSQPEPVLSDQELLEQKREEIIQELDNFYESVILKVSFNGELIWIPFADRVAYKSYLEDIQTAGITDYNWHGVTLPVESLLEILRQVNVYEYRCNEVYTHHVDTIRTLSASELNSYDYTEGYPEGISL